MQRYIRYTITDFNRDFPDDDACLEYVKNLIYPNGIVCRECNVVRSHHRLTKRKAYSCDHCGTHVYPLAGSTFARSRSSLKSWFYAMYLMASTRTRISAKQLEREIGCTYKTAWRFFKQIRNVMSDTPDAALRDFAIDIHTGD
jgi:transposase